MIVKTCPNIERGIRFDRDGVYACCANTWHSPRLISAEELTTLPPSDLHDLLIARRIALAAALDLGRPEAGSCLYCQRVEEREVGSLSELDFTRLGGPLASGFNLSYSPACNLRCTYCILDKGEPPLYGEQVVIGLIEEFRRRGTLVPGSWIELNGGEPTLLPEFDRLLAYLLTCGGEVCVFSNGTRYSQAIADGLRENKLGLTVSVDAGTRATYAKVHGTSGTAFWKVQDNLCSYQMTGTRNLWPKYVITDDNRTEADLEGFVRDMAGLGPYKVYICPEFPYYDRLIPPETVTFAARLWLALEQAGVRVHLMTDDMLGDPKLMQYSNDIRAEYARCQ